MLNITLFAVLSVISSAVAIVVIDALGGPEGIRKWSSGRRDRFAALIETTAEWISEGIRRLSRWLSRGIL